jgi:hypothetical protein
MLLITSWRFHYSIPQTKYATTAAAMKENIKATGFPFPAYLPLVFEVRTTEGVVVALLDELGVALMLLVLLSVPVMSVSIFLK